MGDPGGPPASSRFAIGGRNGIGSVGLMGSAPRAFYQNAGAAGPRTTASFGGAGSGQAGAQAGAGSSQYGGVADAAYHNGGVATGGQTPQYNSVQQAQMNGPSPEELAAQAARRDAGAQMGQAGNSALAGYMMS